MAKKKAVKKVTVRKTRDVFEVGKCYLVRAVTNYTIGELARVTPNELVFVRASWIGSTGRFSRCVCSGSLDEVEPYPASLPVIVCRGAIVDACEWRHDLPETVK